MKELSPRQPKTLTLPRVTISREAALAISSHALNSPDVETGGILIGFHDGSDIRVKRATGPGERAKRTPTFFLRSTEECQRFLDEEFAISGADYVGEWHSHVVSLNRASDGDLRTLASILADPDYEFPSFAMIVCVPGSQHNSVQMLCYVGQRDKRTIYETRLSIAE